jgi:two-component system cell cycle sensor histidine kinase/response regulator CckA
VNANWSQPETAASPPAKILVGLVAVAFATSVMLVLLSGSWAFGLAYAGGIAVLALLGLQVRRSRPGQAIEPIVLPDFTMTQIAIEDSGRAIGIIDRASRLVCANRNYREWLSDTKAPPQIAMRESSRTNLNELARRAWTDGAARAPGVEIVTEEGEGPCRFDVELERAGRSDEYLVWRFSKIAEVSIVEMAGSLIAGPIGPFLTRAGIEAALVGSDGLIQQATAGLSDRGAGGEPVGGRAFTEFLRVDERDRIFFAHEGQHGTPQMLVNIPLDPPDASSVSTADEAPSLMLLIDGGVGMGALLESGARSGMPQLEAMLSALPLGLALTDRDGRFLFGNKAFKRAVGHTGLQLPAYPSDLVMREDKAALADAVRRYARGATASGDLAVRLLGEPDDPVSLGLASVRGIGDAAVILSIADSTEEQRLRRQVAQATKMQAVGQLAGGVAHDFNNVLTAILGYCDLMLLRHMPGDSDYDDIQQIRANSNRAASLTRHLLAFSRQQTLRPEIVQLPDIVTEVSQLLKRLMGDRITFTVRHDRDLGAVRADPQQLEQVVINLVVNARDAIEEKAEGNAEVTIATRRISPADVAALAVDFMPTGEYTALAVTDTGGGIASEHLGKIFEPFFTTKEPGKGTGLGLSTVYGIVKQSNGFIFADNVTDARGRPTGACFTVYLPVYHGKAEDRAPPILSTPEVSEWTGGATLLLVEDEDMVRAVVERALTRAGYEVTACADGEEGAAAIRRGDKFDLVVSDVVMPGMDGPEMAREIRKLQPDLPILFMSGYAEEQLRREIDIERMHFIAKPFSVQDISAEVARILNHAFG